MVKNQPSLTGHNLSDRTKITANLTIRWNVHEASFQIEILSLVAEIIRVLEVAKRFVFVAVLIYRDLIFVPPHKNKCSWFSRSSHELADISRSKNEEKVDPITRISVKEKQRPPVNKTRLVTELKRLREKRQKTCVPPDTGCKNTPINKTRKKLGGGGGGYGNNPSQF